LRAAMTRSAVMKLSNSEAMKASSGVSGYSRLK
jgi:hypothetical protein